MTQAVVGKHYRHQKGGEYEVTAIAEHTETGEEMVVYKRQSDGKVYARPKAMFENTKDGRPRFVCTDDD